MMSKTLCWWPEKKQFLSKKLFVSLWGLRIHTRTRRAEGSARSWKRFQFIFSLSPPVAAPVERRGPDGSTSLSALTWGRMCRSLSDCHVRSLTGGIQLIMSGRTPLQCFRESVELKCKHKQLSSGGGVVQLRNTGHNVRAVGSKKSINEWMKRKWLQIPGCLWKARLDSRCLKFLFWLLAKLSSECADSHALHLWKSGNKKKCMVHLMALKEVKETTAC